MNCLTQFEEMKLNIYSKHMKVADLLSLPEALTSTIVRKGTNLDNINCHSNKYKGINSNVEAYLTEKYC